MSAQQDNEAPQVSEVDVVSASAAEALHNLLDAPGPAPRTGEPLPPLWHWLAFLPRTPQRELGNDGHPSRPPETLPEKFPQRMFAGAQLSIFRDVRVGMSMARSSTTLSMTEKVGKSGPMLFASIENRYETDGASAIVEVQDIVYRKKTKKSEVGQIVADTMRESQFIWGLDVRVDATLLFRFSALTYNAHRIHYDLNFAKNEEGYPGLVVHGPLQALFLAELCRRHAQNERIEDFEFRALHPLFDGGTMRLRATREGQKVSLLAFDQFGQNTMKASATLANLV